MDIAALSMSLSQASLSQAVSLTVASLAKGQAESQSQSLVQMMNGASIRIWASDWTLDLKRITAPHPPRRVFLLFFEINRARIMSSVSSG